MKNLEKVIWIEAEQWSDDQWNKEDVNSDVIVTFSNRTKWIATFFTYKNIQTLREKNRLSGECLNGNYYWSSDMILIDILNKERIHEVINYLLEKNEFKLIFNKCSDVEHEDDM